MKVLTIGGAMIDTIAVIASERIERMAMRNAETSFLLLEEGRKIEAENVSTHCGGGAVNAAVALARQGHDVSALVVLGQDARAETILARLSDEGVSARFVCRDARAPTGASVLVSAHDRNAAVFTFRGANALLEPKDLKTDAFAADLVYVAGLSNASADCFALIVEKAKAAGAVVATNPGIRQLSARQRAFRDVLARIDILALNRHEAGALVPWLSANTSESGAAIVGRAGEELPELARHGFAAGGFEMSLTAFMKALLRSGPKWVVVTDGKDGAYIGAKEVVVHVPTVSVEVAGTAGAGDAFAATFAAYVTETGDTVKAGLAATINAASVVGFVDTQTGLLQRSELEARMVETTTMHKVQIWPN
jgi:ribokinase